MADLSDLPNPHLVTCIIPTYEEKHVQWVVWQYLQSAGFQHTASAFSLELRSKGVSEDDFRALTKEDLRQHFSCLLTQHLVGKSAVATLIPASALAGATGVHAPTGNCSLPPSPSPITHHKPVKDGRRQHSMEQTDADAVFSRHADEHVRAEANGSPQRRWHRHTQHQRQQQHRHSLAEPQELNQAIAKQYVQHQPERPRSKQPHDLAWASPEKRQRHHLHSHEHQHENKPYNSDYRIHNNGAAAAEEQEPRTSSKAAQRSTDALVAADCQAATAAGRARSSSAAAAAAAAGQGQQALYSSAIAAAHACNAAADAAAPPAQQQAVAAAGSHRNAVLTSGGSQTGEASEALDFEDGEFEEPAAVNNDAAVGTAIQDAEFATGVDTAGEPAVAQQQQQQPDEVEEGEALEEGQAVDGHKEGEYVEYSEHRHATEQIRDIKLGKQIDDDGCEEDEEHAAGVQPAAAATALGHQGTEQSAQPAAAQPQVSAGTSGKTPLARGRQPSLQQPSKSIHSRSRHNSRSRSKSKSMNHNGSSRSKSYSSGSYSSRSHSSSRSRSRSRSYSSRSRSLGRSKSERGRVNGSHLQRGSHHRPDDRENVPHAMNYRPDGSGRGNYYNIGSGLGSYCGQGCSSHVTRADYHNYNPDRADYGSQGYCGRGRGRGYQQYDTNKGGRTYQRSRGYGRHNQQHSYDGWHDDNKHPPPPPRRRSEDNEQGHYATDAGSPLDGEYTRGGSSYSSRGHGTGGSTVHPASAATVAAAPAPFSAPGQDAASANLGHAPRVVGKEGGRYDWPPSDPASNIIKDYKDTDGAAEQWIYPIERSQPAPRPMMRKHSGSIGDGSAYNRSSLGGGGSGRGGGFIRLGNRSASGPLPHTNGSRAAAVEGGGDWVFNRWQGSDEDLDHNRRSASASLSPAGKLGNSLPPGAHKYSGSTAGCGTASHNAPPAAARLKSVVAPGARDVDNNDHAARGSAGDAAAAAPQFGSVFQLLAKHKTGPAITDLSLISNGGDAVASPVSSAGGSAGLKRLRPSSPGEV